MTYYLQFSVAVWLNKRQQNYLVSFRKRSNDICTQELLGANVIVSYGHLGAESI